MVNKNDTNPMVVENDLDLFTIKKKRGRFEWFSLLNDNIISGAAQKSRKTMFIVSAMGIVIAITGWIPTEFTPFGIKFEPQGQIILLNLIVLDIVYLLICFLVYGISDISDWYYKCRKEETYQAQDAIENKVKSIQLREPGPVFHEIQYWLSRMTLKTKNKHFLNKVFPVLIAITATISLLLKNYG